MLKPLLLLLATLSPLAMAQTQPPASPYAGEQHRALKALSEEEIAQLRGGEGMGFAKAAELNGYPGPAHVVALAAPLHLTPAQAAASRELLAAHKARAQRIGAALVEAEGALDRAFAERHADARQIARLVDQAGALRSELRAEHLLTHLAQAKLLTPEQVALYAQLRGYTGDAPAAHRHGSS
jgi:Spy/CpxP family protein refolding chaperone